MSGLAPRVLATLIENTLVLADGVSVVRLELPDQRVEHPLDSRQLPLDWLAAFDSSNEIPPVLAELGWLDDAPALPANQDVISLRDAIRAVRETGALSARAVVTSDEVLLFADHQGRSERVATLRRFISRLDWRRLQAYAGLTWRPPSRYWVWGDAPQTRSIQLENNVATSTVRSLRSAWTLIDRPEPTDRLDLVAEVERHTIEVGSTALAAVVATYAQPNLAFVADPTSSRKDHRWCMGVADDFSTATAKAHGEGVERYALGDYDEADLRRASVSELAPHPVLRPERLVCYSARQRRERGLALPSPSEREWWVLGERGDATPSWLPAFAVFCPFGEEPAWLRTGYSSSNGAAAHPQLREARRLAWLELNERDAFLRTFLSRLPPRRLAPSTLPSSVTTLMSVTLDRFDLDTVEIVNFMSSLGLPVTACVARRRDRFAIGASCKAELGDAALKAVTEVLLQLRYPFGSETTRPEDVVTPEDHARFYSSSTHVPALSWLFDGETFDGADMSVFDDVDELMSQAFFFSKLTADLAVARALDPRLIPMTFGYDTLPEDLPPVQAALGHREQLLVPHPFP